MNFWTSSISSLFVNCLLKNIIWNNFKAVKVTGGTISLIQHFQTLIKNSLYLFKKKLNFCQHCWFLWYMPLVSLTCSGEIMHSSLTAVCPQCNSQNQSYFKTSWKLQKSILFSSRSYQTRTTHLSDSSQARAFSVSSQQYKTQIASPQMFWALSKCDIIEETLKGTSPMGHI